MKVQVFHLFFKAQGDSLVPADEILFKLASVYVEENMDARLDFRDFKNVWVACEVDGAGTPLRALGILCMMLRADFPVCRFTDNAAVVKLVQRANDHLHDVYGARGTYALVRIAKPDSGERMCPDHGEWMKLFDLKEADRWEITVR